MSPYRTSSRLTGFAPEGLLGYMQSKRGILYAASGEMYAREATASAYTARDHMPDLPRILFTDKAEYGDPVFDEVRVIEEPTYSYRDKILPLTQSPFEETIFLDTDTYVASPFPEVFDLLDRFELGIAHDPCRACEPTEAPQSFVEMNTGVILYRNTERVRSFFHDWLANHEALREKNSKVNDQVAFRKTLFASDLRFYILPQEYNFRLFQPYFAGDTLPVKILHGRGIDLPELEARLNKTDSYRVYLTSIEQFLPETTIFTTRYGTWMQKALAPFIRLMLKLRKGA